MLDRAMVKIMARIIVEMNVMTTLMVKVRLMVTSLLYFVFVNGRARLCI